MRKRLFRAAAAARAGIRRTERAAFCGPARRGDLVFKVPCSAAKKRAKKKPAFKPIGHTAPMAPRTQFQIDPKTGEVFGILFSHPPGEDGFSIPHPRPRVKAFQPAVEKRGGEVLGERCSFSEEKEPKRLLNGDALHASHGISEFDGKRCGGGTGKQRGAMWGKGGQGEVCPTG